MCILYFVLFSEVEEANLTKWIAFFRDNDDEAVGLGLWNNDVVNKYELKKLL